MAAGATLLHRRVVCQIGQPAVGQVLRVGLTPPADAAAARFVEDLRVILDPVLRAVDLADRRGPVPRRAEMPQHARQTGRLRARQAVIPVVVTVLSRQPRHAAGRADRVLRNRAGKAHPLFGQPVQVRRPHVRMPRVPQHLGVVLVGQNEQHVRSVGHARFLKPPSAAVSLRKAPPDVPGELPANNKRPRPVRRGRLNEEG